MNVAQDTRNSSVLAVGDRHVRAVPDSRTVAVERVRVVYGATASLRSVTRLLERRDFAPIAFEGVLDDPDTGEML